MNKEEAQEKLELEYDRRHRDDLSKAKSHVQLCRTPLTHSYESTQRQKRHKNTATDKVAQARHRWVSVWVGGRVGRQKT